MNIFIKLYAITLPIFFAIDLVWLAVVAKNFYAKHIGFLLSSQVNWPAAILFYLLFIVGLVVFVIHPSVEAGSLLRALTLGVLFGVISYATYDLTNLATVKDWPVIVTIVDMIWGGVLAASVSVIATAIALRLHI